LSTKALLDGGAAHVATIPISDTKEGVDTGEGARDLGVEGREFVVAPLAADPSVLSESACGRGKKVLARSGGPSTIVDAGEA
jgi:hypothetical protein